MMNKANQKIEQEARQNLYVLWIGVFMVAMGLSAALPFLPLYLSELGDFSKSELNLLSSVTFSVSFLMSAIASPFWGRMADKYGCRPMLLRASFCLTFVVGAMGLVTTAWQLIGLRAIQGVFGGFIVNSTALIAIQTPKDRSGHALAILSTGTTSGALIGPLMGAIIASFVGYRGAFLMTGAFFFIIFFLVFFFVRERKVVKEVGNEKSDKTSLSWQALTNKQFLLGLFMTTLLIQIVNTSVSPVLALFIQELNQTSWDTTMLVGIIAAAPGIAALLVAPHFGRLGDRMGAQYILIAAFLFSFFVQIPTAFVTSVLSLLFFRLMIGVSDAAMLPQINALLTKSVPREFVSQTFAYNQSAMSIGNMLGPLIGGFVSNLWGYRSIFIIAALLTVFNLLHFLLTSKKMNMIRLKA